MANAESLVSTQTKSRGERNLIRMKKKITEITDIRLGYQFREKIEPVDDGTHRVIQIRDFDDHRILHKEGLSRVKINKPAEHYLINDFVD